MLVFSKKNAVYAKRLHSISFFLNREAKKYQDLETRKAIQEDAKSVKAISEKLLKNNPAAASALMFKLDRILIDYAIPTEVFNYLEDYHSK